MRSPSILTHTVTSSPQSGFRPSCRPVGVGERAVVARRPVVVEDHALVQLAQVRHAGCPAPAVDTALGRRRPTNRSRASPSSPSRTLAILDPLAARRRRTRRSGASAHRRAAVRGSSDRRARSSSSRPTVAPCVHFTSSAKISSCGLVSTWASADSSRLLLVCLPSVFCASGCTYTLPLNTPCDRAVEHALVDLAAGAVRLRRASICV